MVNARPQPEQPHTDARFNVLLASDRQHAIEHWSRQLPALLQPQGVHAYVVGSGRDAIQVVETYAIHAAVIDLGTPRSPDARDRGVTPGGIWLLEVFKRLPQRPPVVVVNPRTPAERQVQRLLNEALRLGAFSVLNQPVQLDALLSVIRRLLEREYRGQWPSPPPPVDDFDEGQDHQRPPPPGRIPL